MTINWTKDPMLLAVVGTVVLAGTILGLQKAISCFLGG